MADREFGKVKYIVKDKPVSTSFNSDSASIESWGNYSIQVNVKNTAESGDAITVDAAKKATVDIADLTYTADDAGAAGNDISVEYLDSVKASKIIQDLTYTADAKGSAGNAINITYVTGGAAGSEVVSVSTNDITVTIEDGVSTATQIKAALDGDGSAAALVDISVSGTGTNTQDVQAATNLEGGLGGAAGSEEVVVTGEAIQVYIEDGVSTATQVKTAVDALPAAAALVDVTVTGVGSNAQAVTAETALEDGADSLVSVANDTLTATAHGLSTGVIVQLTTTGTLPTGLALATDYYVIKVDANTIKLASSLNNALAGTAVDITADGTADSTITVTPEDLDVTVELQASLDQSTWIDVQDSLDTNVTAPGSVLFDVADAGYPFVRVKTTVTTGFGYFDIILFAKD